MIKKIVRKLIFGYKSDTKSYIKYLNKLGTNIDETVTMYSPESISIDTQYPFLINIGKNVQITEGVTLLTHDYSWSVIKGMSGELVGASGKIEICDNVFIGRKSFILRGVKIGENSVIGANSVVTKNVPANEVWGGNPAKFICSIDEFYRKRISKQVEEAFVLYRNYRDRYDNDPSEEIFFEYVSLFVDFRKKENVIKYKSRINLMNSSEKTISYYGTKAPMFSSFEDMINNFKKHK